METRSGRFSNAIAVRGVAASAVNMFIGGVIPPVCPVCRSITTASGALCGACWRGLDFLTPPLCRQLGTPLPFDPGMEVVSPAAQADPPPWDRARAAVAYDDTARVLVTALKYRDRMDVAATMARMMARAGRELLQSADLVAPVPLHFLRLWSRRFNQANELAREVAALAGKPHDPVVLRRRKPTRRQVGLSASQRARNVAGAFVVDPARRALLEGRRVLLVDDVLTTGATARAAARTLRRAGASVDVLAFAMVVERG
ncbi:MAG: ComF family protein [Flavobacteriaceae bacterium]